MPSVSFARAVPEDADYYYATRKEGMEPHMAKIGRVWDDAYERRYNGERFLKQLPYLRMIEADGTRVGFIAVRPDGGDAVYLESFCIERRYQNQDISKKVLKAVLQEPTLRGRKFMVETMKGYASGRLAQMAGFRLIDDSGEFALYERPVPGTAAKQGARPQ